MPNSNKQQTDPTKVDPKHKPARDIRDDPAPHPNVGPEQQPAKPPANPPDKPARDKGEMPDTSSREEVAKVRPNRRP